MAARAARAVGREGRSQQSPGTAARGERRAGSLALALALALDLALALALDLALALALAVALDLDLAPPLAPGPAPTNRRSRYWTRRL